MAQVYIVQNIQIIDYFMFCAKLLPVYCKQKIWFIIIYRKEYNVAVLLSLWLRQ